MKILALESAALTASAAVCEDEHLLGETLLNNGHTHSETLLPMAEALLGSLGLTAADIDLFAVSAGPGSFTGVRIGVATAKGLAFGSGKPCIGVSTLEALACNLPLPGGLICPAMNARRGQVYTALFRGRAATDTQLTPERLMPDSAIPISELDAILKRYDEPVYLCGDGYELCAAGLHHPIGNTPDRLRWQSAASVARAALAAYRAGVRTTDAELKPIYLRPCQAERERMAREQAAQATDAHGMHSR